MKTQLLEDIGQSATLSLVPSKQAQDLKPGTDAESDPVQTRQAATPRVVNSVWRQKPAAEPVESVAAQPDQQLTPLELNSVFEEIAALEAQYAAPAPPSQRALTSVAPQRVLDGHQSRPVEGAPDDHAVSAHAAESVARARSEPRRGLDFLPSEPIMQRRDLAEPTLTLERAPAQQEPIDPLFDFTPSPPTTHTFEPFTRAQAEPTASGRRYLLWGVSVLTCALLAQGGWWLYQQRTDGAASALVATLKKEDQQAEKAAKRRAMAAKEFTLGPDGDVRVASVTSAAPATVAAPVIPPLVLLEPEAPAGAARAPSPAKAPAPTSAERSAKQDTASQREPAASSRKVQGQTAGQSTGGAAKPVDTNSDRQAERVNSRVSLTGAGKTAAREAAMAATLKACREHGYHAEQCLKRGCSVTKYGFVCRGQ